MLLPVEEPCRLVQDPHRRRSDGGPGGHSPQPPCGGRLAGHQVLCGLLERGLALEDGGRDGLVVGNCFVILLRLLWTDFRQGVVSLRNKIVGFN